MIKRIRNALLELENIEASIHLADNMTFAQKIKAAVTIGHCAVSVNNLLMELIDDNDNNSRRTNGGEGESGELRNGHVERRLSLIQGGKQE